MGLVFLCIVFMKIVVLVPNSYFVSNIDQQLMATIQLAFDHSFKPDIEIEMVGFSSTKDSVVSQLQKLLLTQSPDAVIGAMGMNLLIHVGPVFERFKVPFLLLDPGVDILKNDEANPYVFANTFGLFQSAWESGHWAANNISKKAAIVTSFHEAGYEFGAAFESGYRTSGGDLVQVASVHKESRTEDTSDALNHILDMEPGMTMVFASSKEAISLAKDYFSLSRYDNIPMVASYSMFEGNDLQDFHKDMVGVPFVASWIPNLNSEANAYFRKAFSDTGLGIPGMHSLLTWESIHLLKLAAAYQKENGGTLAKALRSVSFKGPRGTIAFTGKLGETTGFNQHLCRVVNGGDGLRNKSGKDPFDNS